MIIVVRAHQSWVLYLPLVNLRLNSIIFFISQCRVQSCSCANRCTTHYFSNATLMSPTQPPTSSPTTFTSSPTKSPTSSVTTFTSSHTKSPTSSPTTWNKSPTSGPTTWKKSATQAPTSKLCENSRMEIRQEKW